MSRLARTATAALAATLLLSGCSAPSSTPEPTGFERAQGLEAPAASSAASDSGYTPLVVDARSLVGEPLLESSGATSQETLQMVQRSLFVFTSWVLDSPANGGGGQGLQDTAALIGPGAVTGDMAADWGKRLESGIDVPVLTAPYEGAGSNAKLVTDGGVRYWDLGIDGSLSSVAADGPEATVTLVGHAKAGIVDGPRTGTPINWKATAEMERSGDLDWKVADLEWSVSYGG